MGSSGGGGGFGDGRVEENLRNGRTFTQATPSIVLLVAPLVKLKDHRKQHLFSDWQRTLERIHPNSRGL